MSLIAEVLSELLINSDGLIFLIGLGLTLAVLGVPHRRLIWSVIRGRSDGTQARDELSALAEDAGHWLEALGTDGGGMIAAEWFRENEPKLRKLFDTTDLTPDRVDNLASICDALDAWYVRQRRGTALLELSERLATIGEQAHRSDLQQLAAVRAATAHRLLNDSDAAITRLGMATGGPRNRVTAAVRARYRLERGLLHLARADQNAPGADRDDAIRDARNCFDEAALAAPRADLATDIAININLAVTCLYQHDPDAALDHLRLASAHAAAAHDASAGAHVLELSGVAAWLQDNSHQAIGWWRRAEQQYADIDEHIGRARCLQHLGASELAGGNTAAALTLLERSAHLLGGPTGHEILEHYLAKARASLGRDAEPATKHPFPSRRSRALDWLYRIWHYALNRQRLDL